MEDPDRRLSAGLAFQLIAGALPWLGSEGLEVVRLLAHRAPRVIDSVQLSRQMGLRDRHALRRSVDRSGLPPIRELSGWVRVLVLVLEWEQRGIGLSGSAHAAGKDPAGYTRVVHRLTGGLSWREVRQRGSSWILLQFVERCRRPDNGSLRRSAAS